MKRLLSRFSNLNKKHDVGLVLSGGGARGFAHIGVLKALNEHGIYPTMISGVSSGAIIGVLYADGYKPEEIYNIFKERDLFKFIHIAFPRDGLLKMRGLIDMLKSSIRAETFEDLGIKVIVNSTDLVTAKPIRFSSGELIKPILASVAIPVLFSPVKIDDMLCVDGGLLDNLPIQPLNGNCRKIIGVNVNPIGKDKSLRSIRDVALRTFQISVSGNIQKIMHHFDLYIEPKGLENFALLSVSRSKEIFDIGYEETCRILEQDQSMAR